jgi:LDH2 family malate/lactate/ureidoglycolate dehydrogenase
MGTIRIEDLKDFCIAVLCKEGMSLSNAEATAEVLVETDAFGTHSHGTKNLDGYIRKAHVGGLDLLSYPEIITEGPAYAVLDAHDGIGMVAGTIGMDMAVEKAKTSGISLVSVKNSCHYGAAGYYANYAALNGCIGISMSNVDPNMTVPGAKGMVIGNNPFAYAAPSKRYPTIFFDVALSSVASLKVVQAKSDGTSIPPHWIVDKDGLPTTDPSKYPEEGAMQPMAAHKGYGLAVMVDLLSGLLINGCTSVGKEIPSWCFALEKTNNVCHTFIAIDPSKFSDTGLPERVELMAQQLRSADKAMDSTRIYTPGEIEWEKHLKAEEEGIVLPLAVEQSLMELSQYSKVELKLITS